MKGRDVILGSLMKRPMSGYDIKLVFEDIFSHFFDGSFGMIYPTLRQLEKEGLIRKEVVIQDGKPNKNLYSITPQGVEEFNKYLQKDMQKDILVSDFLMRMYFGEYVEKLTLIKWIEDEIVIKENNIKQLQEKKIEWSNGITPSQEICLELGIANYSAYLETLKQKLYELNN